MTSISSKLIYKTFLLNCKTCDISAQHKSWIEYDTKHLNCKTDVLMENSSFIDRKKTDHNDYALLYIFQHFMWPCIWWFNTAKYDGLVCKHLPGFKA